MIFFLGITESSWIDRMTVPFMLSRQRVMRGRTRKPLPRAKAPWVLDSGGFTMITKVGRWTINERDLVETALFYRDEVGKLLWSSPMDWMVEEVARKKSCLTTSAHQELTVQNYLRLMSFDWRGLYFLPVLQGNTPDDYLRHLDMYRRVGVDLETFPLVGLGSMCRRAQMGGPVGGRAVIERLFQEGLTMHAFGYKQTGLKQSCSLLASSDSDAWSAAARNSNRMVLDSKTGQWERKKGLLLPGHDHRSTPRSSKLSPTNNCSNCLEWALVWRSEILSKIDPYCAEQSVHPSYASFSYQFARRFRAEHEALTGAPKGTYEAISPSEPLKERFEAFSAIEQAIDILRTNLDLLRLEEIEDYEEADRLREKARVTLYRSTEPETPTHMTPEEQAKREDPNQAFVGHRVVPSPQDRERMRLALAMTGHPALARALRLPEDPDDFDAFEKLEREELEAIEQAVAAGFDPDTIDQASARDLARLSLGL